MAFARIDIVGLKEFQKSLRDMDANLPKKIRIALNKSAQLVIDYAQPKIPKKSGRAAGSLKVRSSQRAARIAAGGTRAPYYPWLDYGGAVGRNGSTKRPFQKTGRYIYPGLERNRDDITESMSVALTELATEAGLEVT